MSAQHQRSNECRRFVFVIEAIRVYARHRRSAVPCSNQTRSRHESLQDAALWSASPRPLMPTYSPNSFGYAAVASASYHNSGEENVSMSIPERESPYRRAQETCRAKVSADPVISALLSILGAECHVTRHGSPPHVFAHVSVDRCVAELAKITQRGSPLSVHSSRFL
jgi:hypothetical protein